MEKQEEAKCIVNFTIHQTAFNYFQIDHNIAIRIHIKRYRITCNKYTLQEIDRF